MVWRSLLTTSASKWMTNNPEGHTGHYGNGYCKECVTGASLLWIRKCSLRRNPKSDGQPVVGVHHADRDRQIDQFLLREHGRSGLEVGVRHGGVGHACDGFGPGKRSTFACVKQAAGLAPRLDQHEFIDGKAFLNQV